MCDVCEWEEYLEIMEVLQEQDLKLNTFDFVEGVYDWVFDNSHITDLQKELIDEIKNNT